MNFTKYFRHILKTVLSFSSVTIKPLSLCREFYPSLSVCTYDHKSCDYPARIFVCSILYSNMSARDILVLSLKLSGTQKDKCQRKFIEMCRWHLPLVLVRT